ncbi:ATP-binding cassette domain-containing protein [Paenibacillus woosongensis]|uniref:ATP-binding cassette domain-containing protein n=1 Tax=Paenibacillus woosongensis TaxID=307580 RepID=A0A7X3CMJ7_9BACL|nr:ATP-binding cassette domain-containing protein [Paenibacillus woosongensis]MUG45280.1 ATP-binding cassette domain-containing protein [Paenibacillus woosongensis]
MEKVISVENLGKKFKYRERKEGVIASLKSYINPQYRVKHALTDISMEINQGELVGFIGPNGAGKTTTIKLLSGILHPSEGSIEVLGYNPFKRQADFLRQISIIAGNKSQLSWDLPAIDSYHLLKNVYGLNNDFFEKQLKYLSKSFEITDLLHRPVRQMSLGERMKSELVAALLHNPKILFLDEPTLGLDVVSQRNFREMIKEYNKKSGTTIILTSHYMKDIKELCNRVIVINQGHKIFDGLLSELEKKYNRQRKISISLDRKVSNYAEILESISSRIAVIKNNQDQIIDLLVDNVEATEVISKVFRALPIIDISIEELDMDDIISNFYLEGKKTNVG